MSSQTAYPTYENCKSDKEIAEKNIFETEAIIKMVEETLRQAAIKYPDQIATFVRFLVNHYYF